VLSDDLYVLILQNLREIPWFSRQSVLLLHAEVRDDEILT